MATITKSIGTTGRDYSSITAWEADLDDTTPYDAGDDAVGECYNDSALDEQVTINGGGTIGLSSVTLGVASGERHDGTAGIGARLDLTSVTANSALLASTATAVPADIEWLEVTQTGAFNGTNDGIGAGNGAHTCKVRNVIVHDIISNNREFEGIILAGGNTDALNCIVYNIETKSTSNDDVMGIRVDNAGRTQRAFNCTVHNTHISGASGTGSAEGISNIDDTDHTIRNCISTDSSTASGSGSASDYAVSSPSNATMDHNAASDTTASGTGSLDSITTADQYVSTTGGSEDLHLKAGADAIDAGTDLGTTPSGVEIDINGRDRDAEADTWDMGAHELVAAAVAAGHGLLLSTERNRLVIN